MWVGVVFTFALQHVLYLSTYIFLSFFQKIMMNIQTDIYLPQKTCLLINYVNKLEKAF